MGSMSCCVRPLPNISENNQAQKSSRSRAQGKPLNKFPRQPSSTLHNACTVGWAVTSHMTSQQQHPPT